MNKIKLLILAVVVGTLAIFSSCTEEDLGPAPVTEFSLSTKKALINESIEFKNFSNLASGGNITYLWEFGDGTTSTQAEPNKIYTSTGTYNISLTATTEQGASAMYADTILIGEMYLTDVEIFDFIETFTFIDTIIGTDTTFADFYWDEENQSGPDLYWVLFDQNDQNQIIESASIATDASSSTIFSISPPASSNFKFTDSSYGFLLFDEDGEDDTRLYGRAFNPTTYSGIFNYDPVADRYEPGRNLETGEGLFYLSAGENLEFGFADIFIHFEIR